MAEPWSLGDGWVEIGRSEYGGKDPSATITYLGPWLERISFAMGRYGRLRFGGFVSPSIYGPLGIFCQGWSAKPFGATNGGEYTCAEVAINYGTNNDEPTNSNGEPADIGDEKFTIAGTTINLPPSQYKWLGGSKEDQYLKEDGDVSPFMIVPEIGYTISYHWVTRFEPDHYAQYVGKINSSPVGRSGVAAKRVMFLGAESSRKLTAEGILNWKVDFNFSIKGIGQTWNKFWDGSSWQEIGFGEDNDRPYVEANLNDLFPS